MLTLFVIKVRNLPSVIGIYYVTVQRTKKRMFFQSCSVGAVHLVDLVGSFRRGAGQHTREITSHKHADLSNSFVFRNSVRSRKNTGCEWKLTFRVGDEAPRFISTAAAFPHVPTVSKPPHLRLETCVAGSVY